MPRDPSDKAVKVAPSNTPDHDAASLPVGLQETPATAVASEGVALNWLQNRLDLLIIAGCANAVRGLTASVRGLQFIDDRTEIGALKRVSARLGLKSFRAMLLCHDLGQRALHRYHDEEGWFVHASLAGLDLVEIEA